MVMRTSFLVTGFSNNTRCVNFVRPRRGSKSASSAMLFAVKTSVERLGIEFEMFDWICRTRFLARRSVCNRGKNGKLPSEEMSLSVKSIASWSCPRTTTISIHSFISRPRYERQGRWLGLPWQYPGSQLRGSCALNDSNDKGRYQSSSCKSVVSVLFRHCVWNAPRRSSSRSFSGLMYDREFWISSTVRRMVAVFYESFINW